jgi:putative transposase
VQEIEYNQVVIRTKVFKAKQPKSILDELNRESGKLYSEVMVEHWRVYRNHNIWLSVYTERKYNDRIHPVTILHSHSKDAAQMAFSKDAKTTRALRKAGFQKSKFPHKVKMWRTTIWGKELIRIKEGIAFLPMAMGLEPIRVTLPNDLQNVFFLEARLVYNKKQSHYDWHFVFEDGVESVTKSDGSIVSVDLGEIHPAAMTDGNTALVITARELRATGQGLQRNLSILNSRLSRCKRGSRMYRKLSKAKSKARLNADARQKDILHKVSRAVVDFAVASNAKEIAIGDIRDISDEVNLGKKTNQKISLWPHGKLTDYVKYKSARLGIAISLENEAYTTQTCPCCGEKQKPRGRVYKCKKCGFVGHRDVVGACNILSRRLYGELARVQVSITKYRHPYITGKRSHPDTVEIARESEKPRYL